MNVLISTEEPDYRDLLSFFLESEFLMNIVESASLQESLNILKSEPEGLDLIVANYATQGAGLIKHVLGNSIQVHLMFIADKPPTDPVFEKRKDWMHFVESSALIENLDGSLRKLFKDITVDTRAPELQFCKVKTSLLPFASPMKGDVYIRLSDLKHIRILRAGDTFDEFDQDYYQNKKKLPYIHLQKKNCRDFAILIKTNLDYRKAHPVTVDIHDPKRILARKIELLKRRQRELEAQRAAEKAGANAQAMEEERKAKEEANRKAKEDEAKRAQAIADRAKELVAQKAEAAAKAREALEKARLEAEERKKANTQAAMLKELEKDLGAQLDSVQKLSDRLGFTPELQEVTKKHVLETISLVRTAPKLSMILKQLRLEKEKYISSHSMLLAHVSCALAAQMEWSSDTTFQKLTLAAFLHDITLKNQQLAAIGSLEELEEKSAKFTPEEIKAYKNHMMVAAEQSRTFKEVPPDVDTIIAQHHERPDGSGFPRKLTHSRMLPLSTVFIVAHDLVDYLFANNISDSLTGMNLQDFIAKHAKTYQFGNFRKVLAAVPQIKA